MTTISREAILELMTPVLDRVTKALLGEPAGVAMYACLSMAVVQWRKTGLSVEYLHEIVDEFARMPRRTSN